MGVIIYIAIGPPSIEGQQLSYLEDFADMYYLLPFSDTDSISSLTLTVSIVTVASLIFYQLVLHPLARYPGPFVAKFTNFWYYFFPAPQCNYGELIIFATEFRRFATFLRGSQHTVDAALHHRYGSIVRDGPNSLLIADPEIYRTIYGFNKPEIVKKGDFYRSMWNKDHEYPNLLSAATEAQHRYARRAIASTAVGLSTGILL